MKYGSVKTSEALTAILAQGSPVLKKESHVSDDFLKKVRKTERLFPVDKGGNFKGKNANFE